MSMELLLVTDFGWRESARGEGRDDDCGIFAPADALAQPGGGVGGGVVTRNLENVSRTILAKE